MVWTLLLVLPAGCAGPAPNESSAPAGESTSMSMDSGAAPMGHEIPSGDPVPAISLQSEGESDGTWAFSITTDMALTIETKPYEPMLGHVHVYVDGVEKQMIAVKRFTLAELPPGTHRITVALADTTHRDLLRGGQKIEDGLEITVPASQ